MKFHISVVVAHCSIELFFLFHTGHLDIFEYLVHEYEKRNVDFVNSTDTMGMNLLHFGTMNRSPNNCAIIGILLKKNMDVNSIADDKTTPLHYACATGLHFSSISVSKIFGLFLHFKSTEKYCLR